MKKIYKSHHSPSGEWRKILFVMKIKLVLLLCCAAQLSAATSFSQQPKFDVSYQDRTIISVLDDLRAKTGYTFVHRLGVIPEDATVSTSLSDASLDEILEQVLTANGFRYSIEGKIVVVNRTERVQQPAAQRVLRGSVTDENGGPLAGVTVIISESKAGAITDAGGKYTISLPARGTYTLVFSFMGMEEQTIQYNGQPTINVRMKSAVMKVDEVVITGYGTFDSKSFTGNYTTVTGRDLLNISTGNILQSLQIFDPSLRLVTNNEMGSDPNTLPELYIRGESGIGATDSRLVESTSDDITRYSLQTNPNLPVFILDGHEVSVEQIYDMDPYRIGTVTILKDAAATAMHGSRASNGVIVIETIMPQIGKLQISYSMSGAVKVPDLTGYNMMNAREKVKAEFPNGPQSYADLEQYNIRMNAINRGVDTYWLSQPLRTEFNHSHNLYVEGGENSIRFGLGLNYSSNNGVMKGSFRSTLGASLRLDYRLKTFQITNDLKFSHMDSEDSPYGAFSDYVKLQPYWAPYDPDTGEIVKSFTAYGASLPFENPLYEATIDNKKQSGYWGLNNNLTVQGTWNHFTLRFKLGLTYQNSNKSEFTDPLSATYSRIEENYNKGALRLDSNESFGWTTTITGNYNRSFEDHNINLNVSAEARQNRSNAQALRYRGFPSAQFSKPKYARELIQDPTLDDSYDRSVGAVFSGNYTFKNIYLLDVSVRTDGSSKFGVDHMFGTFWSFGAGLNLDRYEWVESLGFLKRLKVRATYGITGRSSFDPYDATNLYGLDMSNRYSTGYGATLQHVGNANLSWDKQATLNLGFDATLGSRLSFSFSWYDKRTNNMITSVSLPSSTGFTSYKENLGDVLNRGLELNLSYTVLTTRDWAFTVSANAAHNSNKILKISDALKEYNQRVDDYYKGYTWNNISPESNRKYVQPVKKYVEGGSLTSIYGMESLGVAPANGLEMYRNLDGTVTYTWSAGEQRIVGNTTPDLQGSFTLSLRYKAFSVFASFMYEFGGELYNSTLINRVESVKLFETNADRRLLTDRWTKPGDVVPYKRIDGNSQFVTLPTSRFVQKNNTLKFNSVRVNYDFDRKLVSRIGLKRLNFALTMNDLGVLSTIDQERGTSYPFARSFGFTLSTGF